MDMRKNFPSLAFAATSLFLLLGSSCSLVYDLNPDQCSTNADCVALFGKGNTCELGICKCQSASCMGGASSGGNGATGGANGATGGTGDDGGTSANAGSGETGGGDAGMGGAPEPRCETHKDCFDAYPDSNENPRACVEGECVPLMSPDCPNVLPISDNGTWNLLKSTNAIVLGAFGPLSGTSINTYGRNYDLAVSELSKTTQGVYSSTSTKKRQVVVVLCNGSFATQDKLLVPAKHLMEELKVPGVVSALLLQDQSYVWDNVARDNQVLMMVPVYSDQALIDTPDDGLIWHMLSGANKLSVSYQPLLDKTVQHLKALGALGATENLKVSQVKATDEAFLQDTANFLEKNLQFNGQSVGANLNAALYQPIEVTSSYKAPADPQTDAIDKILTFGPHVVIGTTVTEMLQYIIPGVESGWAAQHPTQKRPFYILGALAFNDPTMFSLINNDTSPQKSLYQRILGVNWPAAVDQTVYQDYQARWTSKYGQRQDGYENFYDAMYYLLYGLAAAGKPEGPLIANGLNRVTAHGPKIPLVDVGPNDDMTKYIAALGTDSQSKIELVGAMGPPDWDAYGGRNDPASVWCVNSVGVFKPDQLRYDAATSQLQPSDTAPPDSEISCFKFPAQ